jgi:hypothetical protein
MPTFTPRKAIEVPAPTNTSKGVLEERRVYDSFINDIGTAVGELELGPNETIRKVKGALTRAGNRQGVTLRVWDADGKVSFSKEARPGRPRRAK